MTQSYHIGFVICVQLCFHKGDVITVTQMVDGGWWEGTLRGVTGWFPSNYVREVKASSGIVFMFFPVAANCCTF